MLIREEGKLYIAYANDITEVAQYLEQPRVWRSNQSHAYEGNASWDYGVGYNKAMEMCRTGWHDGAMDLDAMVKVLPPHARLATAGYDIAGDYPDVSRFIAGDPLHMHARKRKTPKAPVLNLVIQTNASGGVIAKAYVQHGAVMAALVDAIENAGRRVELDALTVSNFRAGEIISGWKVKRAEDPLDLGAVSWSIGHPACFRRVSFAMWERSPLKYDEGTGYGHPGTLTAAKAAMIGADNAIMLPGINKSIDMKPADALRQAKKFINDAAGETIVEMEE